MFKVSLLSLIFCLAPWAQTQKAHVHGAASLNVALENKKGELEFEAPAEGIVGFERAAKTAAEKKAVESALAKFRSGAAQLFQFPAAAGCTLTAKEIELHREGQHAEVHAHYAVSCQSAPKGQLTLSLFQAFPRLKEVSATLVSDTTQKSAKLSAAKPSIAF